MRPHTDKLLIPRLTVVSWSIFTFNSFHRLCTFTYYFRVGFARENCSAFKQGFITMPTATTILPSSSSASSSSSPSAGGGSCSTSATSTSAASSNAITIVAWKPHDKSAKLGISLRQEKSSSNSGNDNNDNSCDDHVVRVIAVAASGPFGKTLLKAGMIILSVNGQPCHNVEEAATLLRNAVDKLTLVSRVDTDCIIVADH